MKYMVSLPVESSKEKGLLRTSLVPLTVRQSAVKMMPRGMAEPVVEIKDDDSEDVDLIRVDWRC